MISYNASSKGVHLKGMPDQAKRLKTRQVEMGKYNVQSARM